MKNIVRRTQLLEIYQAALQAVAGDRVVSAWLQANSQPGEWAVLAIGKAAAAMARGAQQQLGRCLVRGLVITKHGHSDPSLNPACFTQIESAHPVPDETSLSAGDALMRFLEELPEELPLLFLVSGGASALVEVVPEGMNAEQLSELNRWLLASGLPIEAMNAIRKRLSRIKGGKLAPYLKGRSCVQLLISDVPGDDPAVIGSGMLVPAETLPVNLAIPEWLQRLLQISVPPLSADDPAFRRIETHIIANNTQARRAAAARASELGVPVIDHPGDFQGDAVELASRLTDELFRGEPGIHLWGGESSVRLPREPGRGGRNQHLALAAARRLSGKSNVLLLAAGTDGSDGPTEDAGAGALVDGGTVGRGEEEGLSAADALSHCDAGSFLELSGDLIETGPTGTNVMDLVIGWRWE